MWKKSKGEFYHQHNINIYQFGGPIWAKPMHDAQWVSNILTHLDNNPNTYGQHKKVYGLLVTI
jgi:tRNA G26 N,N-dimethylase Trm1